MPNSDSRSRASAANPATSGTPQTTPLTRRQLRERALGESASTAEQVAPAEQAAPAAPLTRRQRRELELTSAGSASGAAPHDDTSGVSAPAGELVLQSLSARRGRRAARAEVGADGASTSPDPAAAPTPEAVEAETAAYREVVSTATIEIIIPAAAAAAGAARDSARTVFDRAADESVEPAADTASNVVIAPDPTADTASIAVVAPEPLDAAAAAAAAVGSDGVIDEFERAAALVELDAALGAPVATRRSAREAATPVRGAGRRRSAAAAAASAQVPAATRPTGRTPARRVAERPASAGTSRGRTAGSRASGSRASGTRRNWAKVGLSAIAMAFVVGMTAVTAIPTTVSASPVDSNLINLSLNAATSPESQQLITAGSTASEVVNRDGYSVSDVGELQAAGYSTAQLLVGRSLAQELVDAMDSGKLVGSVPDHMKEIRWIAQGVTVPDCSVDYRVLEIIAIAVRNFDQVGVSDINRKCTGQIEGAGTSSSHYIDGGGHAVDFYLLDNKSLNGSDANTLKLISILDPVMPVGARVGQAGCRASAGVTLNLTNWTQFDDSCTHMHVDVPVTDAPLLLADSGQLGQ